jgi:hypothetical protein
MLPASVEVSEYSSRLVGWMNVAKPRDNCEFSLVIISRGIKWLGDSHPVAISPSIVSHTVAVSNREDEAHDIGTGLG